MLVTLGVQKVKRSWNVINSKVFYIFFFALLIIRMLKYVRRNFHQLQ